MIINRLLTLAADDLVAAFSAVKANPTARDGQLRRVRDWLIAHPGALAVEEQSFVSSGCDRHDIFPILMRSASPFERLLETCRDWRNWQLSRRFRFGRKTEAERKAALIDSLTAHTRIDTTLDRTIALLYLMGGLGLLYAPIWWLNWVKHDQYRLAVITGSVTLFTAWLWFAAGHRPFEILSATAAYAAVLMIFMQVSAKVSD